LTVLFYYFRKDTLYFDILLQNEKKFYILYLALYQRFRR